jgi:hypothetical protein
MRSWFLRIRLVIAIPRQRRALPVQLMTVHFEHLFEGSNWNAKELSDP